MHWLLLGGLLGVPIGTQAQSSAGAGQPVGQKTWLDEQTAMRRQLAETRKQVDGRIAALERGMKQTSFEGRLQYREAIRQIEQERGKLQTAQQHLDRATADTWKSVKTQTGKTIREVNARLRTDTRTTKSAAAKN